MLKDVLARIEERLAATNQSASAASRRAGLSLDAIRNIRRKVEAGEEGGVNTRTLSALAPILETTVSYLSDGITGSDESTVRPSGGGLVPARVIGRVAAGMFFEVDDLDQSEPETTWVAPDPRFPKARNMLFDVEGDSMDDLRPRPLLSGDRLQGVSFEDANIPLRDGMIVVVERTRDGGHTREWSVKQVEFYQDRIEFHPRSHNPRHKPIVVKHVDDQDDGVTVTILALITQIITPLLNTY